MRATCRATLFALLWANAALADDLRIVGQDVSWSPTTQPSPTLLIGIQNETGTDDRLAAWQVKLLIVPDPSATGTVLFRSAAKPPTYVFGDQSLGLGPPFTTPAMVLGPIGDGSVSGVVVPASGKNLLQVGFVATSDAWGQFSIAALPGEFDGSSWFSSDFAARAFANVPYGAGPVRIGGVQIENESPEPSSMALLSAGGAILLCGRTVYRRRRKR